MNYGMFVGTTSGVSGLRALLSNYEGANIYVAENNYQKTHVFVKNEFYLLLYQSRIVGIL